MAGESGIHTVPADRGHTPPRVLSKILVILAALAATTGCVYFNSLYNANKIFKQGTKEYEEGRASNGRVFLEESIEKAERIVENKPNSRWADDALRLIVRARILREEWPQTAEASDQLLGYAKTYEDSAEAFGYLGTAKANLGQPAQADSLITVSLSEEKNEKRRAVLLAYRGQARAELGDFEGAHGDLEETSQLLPKWVPPRIQHVRLLADNGRGTEAASEYATLLTLEYTDLEEREVLDLADYLGERDPRAGIDALADVRSSTLLPNNQARLMKLRGDLWAEIGDAEAARAGYQLTDSVFPETRGAAEAQLALVEMDMAQASSIEEFDSLKTKLFRLMAQPSGRRISEVRTLNDQFIRIEYWLTAGGPGYLLAAETTRDQLDAHRLARSMFLAYAAAEPESLWVPKAILAAMDISELDSAGARPIDPTNEELRRRLLEDYRDSAYVGALFGEGGGQYTFEELELNLKQQLDRLKTLATQEVRDRNSAASQQTSG
jgi:hypothetical protein